MRIPIVESQNFKVKCWNGHEPKIKWFEDLLPKTNLPIWYIELVGGNFIEAISMVLQET